MKTKNLYTKLLTVALVLFCFSAFSQAPQQREFLRNLSNELSEQYHLEKETAVRIADSLGMPIRKEFSDGGIIEIQGFENGMPVYYITHNLGGAGLIKSSDVWAGGSAGLSLSGEGQTLGMWDGGATRLTHQEFQGRVVQSDGATSLSNHATHVAGTIVAGGVVSNAKGMSYKANLDAYDWNNDASEMASAASEGLQVSQHSYGTVTGWSWTGSIWRWYGNINISQTEDYGFGFYNSTARNWDLIANNAPNYIIVKSAGNDRGEGPAPGTTHEVYDGGWVTSTATRDKDGGEDGYDCIPTAGNAKNIMTVGAVTGAGNMASFSGWGPTDDGRVKPDIVAKGVSVYSSVASADDNYSSYSGTSMSGPMITGSVGLILEHWENLNSDKGLLRSATIKALILHTADEMGGHVGPDYRYGWGLMNTKAAAQVISDDDLAGGAFNIRELTLNNGQTMNISVRPDGSAPLKATIVWNDPAGTPPAASLNPTDLMLVNDLDMRIEHNATTFYPWILDPANPSNVATTGDNLRDNVEQIYIEEPIAGETYTISITHKNSLAGDSQEFSIIITGITADNVINPLTFTAKALDHSEIELEWTKNNDNEDVMLAWSPDGAFGAPVNGNVYNAGDPIPGGGEVLYRGDALSFIHDVLEETTTYYYRIFSFDVANEYSSGRDANATTPEKRYVVTFEVKNQFDVPVKNAIITIDKTIVEKDYLNLTASKQSVDSEPGLSNIFEGKNIDKSKIELYRMPHNTASPSDSKDEKGGGWIHWDDGVNFNAIGLTGEGVFSIASRWPVDDIDPYDGYELLKIRLFLNNIVNSATIKIWQGPNSTDLVEYVSQPFTQQAESWIEVELDEPYIVNGELELWFGVEFNDPGDGFHPAGIDEFTNHIGKGNMIRLGTDPWDPLSDYGLEGDWNLQAFVKAPSIVLFTDADGKASFETVSGVFDFTVEKEKHETYEGNFEVVVDNVNLNIELIVDTYPLALVADPFDAGGVSGGGEFAEGMKVTVIATPEIGYKLENWKKGETVLSGDQEFEYIMPGEAVTLTAHFVDEATVFHKVNIAIDPDGVGYTTGQGNYQDGDNVTVEAFPFEGYAFEKWTDAGLLDETNNPYSFNMPDEEVNITANFYLIDYELTVEINPEGAGIVEFFPEQDYYNMGDVITLTAIAEDGYEFVNWTDVEDEVLSSDEVFEYTMPASNRTLTANFEPIDYTIAINIEPVETGSVSMNPEKDFYNVGDVVTVKAVPEEGYHFTLWIGDTEFTDDDTNSETITITMPASDVMLEANFDINVYTINAEPNDPNFGSITGKGDYEHGVSVTLTATPETDYKFVKWTEDDTQVSTAAEYTFTATSDHDLVGVFAYNKYTVTFIVKDADDNSITNAIITLEDDTNTAGDYVFEDVEPGEYSFTVTADGFFESSGTVSVVNQDVDKSVAMTIDDTYVETPESVKLAVFPNPARDKFTVESNEIIKQIRLIDISGQVIKEIAVDGLRTEVSVHDLRSGMYFMQIHTSNNVITQRVQVTR